MITISLKLMYLGNIDTTILLFYLKMHDRGSGPYQIDDPTPSKMVVDTGDLIILRSTVMDDDIIDLGIDDNTLPLEDDDLQEEDGVGNGDEEQEDEFDDQETISEEEDSEPEEEDEESE
ncbi:uncharacterized protein DS421_8g226860 [Arachis hypogaea]|nr:uncharacterized protein DS421_8g226860 [Arachis hypogaea]